MAESASFHTGFVAMIMTLPKLFFLKASYSLFESKYIMFMLHRHVKILDPLAEFHKRVYIYTWNSDFELMRLCPYKYDTYLRIHSENSVYLSIP